MSSGRTQAGRYHDHTVMRTVSSHLSECLKSCSSILPMDESEDPSRIARIDANRFMIMLHTTEDMNDVRAVCDQIAQHFAEAIESESGPITFSPRLGAATYPADGQDLETVLHAAGAATHEARETGKSLCFSSQAITAQNIGMLDALAVFIVQGLLC